MLRDGELWNSMTCCHANVSTAHCTGNRSSGTAMGKTRRLTVLCRSR